jgi:signal transduction histidine kinase
MIRILLCAGILLLATADAAFAAPKRVLLLHSFGRDFAPFSEYGRQLRSELTLQSQGHLDIFEVSLATARFPDGAEGPFVDYLRALFVDRPVDLVITIGGPAVSFLQKYRQQLFSDVPVLHTAFEERRFPASALTPKDAVVAASIDFPGSVKHILQVLPDTKNIVIVLGDTPLEKYWAGQIRSATGPFEDRVAFIWFNELSFEDMLKQAAALPPHSAIFFGILSVDAAGVAHEEGRAMARLHAAANAPIFSHIDMFFGQAIVGGPITLISEVSRQAVSAAIRILNGEPPAAIGKVVVAPATPRYDWRELQRWKISEKNLPSGSEVFFRAPGIWEQYQPQVIAASSLLLLQAAIISWLLWERRRRLQAEMEAGSRGREVVRLNRVATAGALSSSIAHELNQPLGAILSNTEAAQILLKADPPDLRQIGEILADIVRDDQRASDIISGLKNLLDNKRASDLQAFDLNDAVRDVAGIVAPEAVRREIILTTDCAAGGLPVRADPIHMQQVILNLAMNALDAMEGCDPKPGKLKIQTLRDADLGIARLAVTDSGRGIPEDKLTTIFEAFFTTKVQGTGLGLPIARTIIHTYGGKIWAENRLRGAAFYFTLPLAKAIAV